MTRARLSGGVKDHSRMTDTTSKFSQQQDEPLFMAVSQKDAAFKAAYARAAETLTRFVELLQSGTEAVYSAKLRFRDPDESERLGENRFLFLWLSNVHYHAAERLFSGTFFEVPPEMQKWHKVGERLGFEGDDIFDWMVLTEAGRITGGYTLRVSRNLLPQHERGDFDRYIGVTEWSADA
jgi:uncharacterized protein YegJ (DUF2314 family)